VIQCITLGAQIVEAGFSQIPMGALSVRTVRQC
jgi:hypothetical protein